MNVTSWRRPQLDRMLDALMPVIATLVALMIGAVMLVLMDASPVDAYKALYEKPFEKSFCCLKSSESPNHEMHHHGVNHGIGGVDPILIIFAQAAIVT